MEDSSALLDGVDDAPAEPHTEVSGSTGEPHGDVEGTAENANWRTWGVPGIVPEFGTRPR